MSKRNREPLETPEQHAERVRLTNLWIEQHGIKAWRKWMRYAGGDGFSFFSAIRMYDGPKAIEPNPVVEAIRRAPRMSAEDATKCRTLLAEHTSDPLTWQTTERFMAKMRDMEPVALPQDAIVTWLECQPLGPPATPKEAAALAQHDADKAAGTHSWISTDELLTRMREHFAVVPPPGEPGHVEACVGCLTRHTSS